MAEKHRAFAQIGALPGSPGKGKNVDLAVTNMDQRQFDQPDYWKHTAETSAFRQVRQMGISAHVLAVMAMHLDYCRLVKCME